MVNSSNSAKKFPRRLSIKRQFYRGLSRYRKKKLDYGRKAFIRRVEYRNMLWERAPPFFIGFTALIAISFIIIDIINFNLEEYPILIVFLFSLTLALSILEIWYVGGDKIKNKVGRKIKRKKIERQLVE
ncbi:MAG: hypothetical protein ACXACU_15365 [Candidatus Hodarchaeales archaeon]